MYPENTRGIIVREHSWIAGLSAFTDMKEPEELQTSRVTKKEPLPEGDEITVRGEQRAENKIIITMSAHFFMGLFCLLIQTLSISNYNYSPGRHKHTFQFEGVNQEEVTGQEKVIERKEAVRHILAMMKKLGVRWQRTPKQLPGWRDSL